MLKVCSRAVGGGSLLVALTVGVAPLALLPARASAADDATTSERAVARRLVAEGDAFFAEQNWAQALARYSEAYRLMHVPTVGVEVVKAQRALGQLVEAAQTAREVTELPEGSGEPVVFQQARRQAAEDLVSLSGLTPSLLLDVAPRGVLFTVQIDAASPAMQTPFPLNPGTHHVRVSADAYQDVDQEVTLQQGERQTLSVTLFADPAPVQVAPPGSGDAAPKAATAPRPAAHGAHASSGRTLGWVGIGIAGVGLAAGSFAGINALQIKPDCPKDVCSPSQRKDIQDSKKMGIIADVSFGVAIVSGALGIWQLVTSSSADDDADSAALELDVGPFELRLSGCF